MSQVRERTFDLFGAGESVPLADLSQLNQQTLLLFPFCVLSTKERSSFTKLVFMEFLAEIFPSSKGQMGRVILNKGGFRKPTFLKSAAKKSYTD